MSSDSCCCLDLFYPVVEIHVGNTILWRVEVWIKFTFVIFDLEGGWKSLLTEGKLIASAAANKEAWFQV